MNRNSEIEDFDVTLEGKYEWALNTLEVLASTRTFQDLVNNQKPKEDLYSAAHVLIRQLVPMECAGFMEVSDTDMSFVMATSNPEDKSDYLQSLINEQIQKGTFAWALQQNKPVTIALDENDKTLLFHSLITPLSVKGMFVGVLD